jgi:hypothetical protein
MEEYVLSGDRVWFCSEIAAVNTKFPKAINWILIKVYWGKWPRSVRTFPLFILGDKNMQYSKRCIKETRNIVTWRLKARIAEPEQTFISRQRLGKHIP